MRANTMTWPGAGDTALPPDVAAPPIDVHGVHEPDWKCVPYTAESLKRANTQGDAGELTAAPPMPGISDTIGGGGGTYAAQFALWFAVELSTAPDGVQPMFRLYG